VVERNHTIFYIKPGWMISDEKGENEEKQCGSTLLAKSHAMVDNVRSHRRKGEERGEEAHEVENLLLNRAIFTENVERGEEARYHAP
jgi:hypothetical protein